MEADKQLADLKETMQRGFKGIEKQIADLAAEIKAHNKAIADQDKAIALANSDIKTLNDKIVEVAQKTDKNHDDIIAIKTDVTSTRRTYNWVIALVTFFTTILTFFLRFFGDGK